MIDGSHFDYNAAYASVDRHQLQDFDPYIYRTRDMGKSWQKITAGLPGGVYVHTVKEDPMRQGLLFAGTERGAYVSFDDGDHWQPLQLNLPITSVRDFQIYANDLIVATHGRGFWVVDDISPMRQITDQVAQADAYLFKPADAISVDQGGDNGTPLQKDEPQAENPADGAYIYYYLKSDQSDPVTLEILDEAGATVQTFSTAPSPNASAGGGFGGRGGGGAGRIPNTSPLWRTTPAPFSGAAGLHRVVWNPAGGRGRGFGGGGFGGGRGGRGGRGSGAAAAPAQTTGTFTAKLTVGGKTFSETFNVKADPRTIGE